MTTAVALPSTRREYREFLQSVGYPKRFASRLAKAFPDTGIEEDTEPTEADKDLLSALEDFTARMKQSIEY